MKKNIVIGLAILAVSTSAALAKHHHGHAKPKEAAATATTVTSPFVVGTAADRELYKKNERDAGVKK
jgi:hypothetical protein